MFLEAQHGRLCEAEAWCRFIGPHRIPSMGRKCHVFSSHIEQQALDVLEKRRLANSTNTTIVNLPA